MGSLMENQTMKFEAHGRVNLIGEHTDYNGGWVLPTLIPQKTTLEVRRRDDQTVLARSSFESHDADEPTRAEYRLGEEKPRKTWIDYIQGATKIVQDLGHKIGGFEVSVDSNVPVGSGLSSSAALEVSVLRALRSMFSLSLTDVEIAQIGQRIENEFVGARVGIMDQMVISAGRAGQAFFLDAMKLEFELVPMPTDAADLVVINSGVAHRLSSTDGGYNQRRAECEEACRSLGIKLLREVTVDDLPRIEKLPDVQKRRARHVVTENARVHLAVKALREGRLNAIGDLFYASHASMRDDYNISIPEIDLLVELCRGQSDTIGARMTGGGFGGSIVALTKQGRGRDVAQAVVESYQKQTKECGTIMVP